MGYEMKRYILIFASLLALVATACAPQVDVESEKVAIEKRVADWLEVTSQGGEAGADGYVTFVTEDVVFLPPNAVRVDGRAGVRELILEFTLAEDFSITWDAISIEVAADGKVAYAIGKFEYSLKDAAGNPVSERGKFLDVLEKQADGSWKGSVVIWNSDLPVGGAAEEGDIDWGPQIQRANEELLNKGNLELAQELFAPIYVNHGAEGDIEGGPDAIKAFVTSIRTAFPDLKVEVEILATEGDRVAWLRTHRGTHQGEYLGVPASGRLIKWRTMIVTRYEEGKIAEEWGVSDLAERLHAN